MFSDINYLSLSVTSIIGNYLKARVEPTQVEGGPLPGQELALPENIMLRWK
jgi:hypothetical protein